MKDPSGLTVEGLQEYYDEACLAALNNRWDLTEVACCYSVLSTPHIGFAVDLKEMAKLAVVVQCKDKCQIYATEIDSEKNVEILGSKCALSQVQRWSPMARYAVLLPLEDHL